MLEIDDAELLKYNQKGLIPAPKESLETFLVRARYSTSLELKGNPFFPEMSMQPLTAIVDVEPFLLVEKLYGFNPTWLQVVISNEKLSPWHGGCAWIYSDPPDVPTTVFLQLRKGAPLFYKPSEIVAHELAHVGRMEFNEPKFEEIFAYQTSSNRFRKWFGAIVESGTECTLFVILLALIFALDLFALLTDQPELFLMAGWLKVAPAALIVYALARLGLRYKAFNSALKSVSRAIANPAEAQAVLYRLSDEELFLFSRMTPLEIREYAVDNASVELRWRLIYKAYF